MKVPRTRAIRRLRSKGLMRLITPKNDPAAYRMKDGAIHLYIPAIAASGNRFLLAHWSDRHKYSQSLGTMFQAARSRLRLELDWTPKKAKVCITRASARRIMDKDNTFFGHKPFLDWLVKVGLLIDDSTDHLTLYEIVQLKPSGDLAMGTHIRIEYEGDDDGESESGTEAQAAAEPGDGGHQVAGEGSEVQERDNEQDHSDDGQTGHPEG